MAGDVGVATEPTLTYTNDDDGIHIRFAGMDRNLGQEPSVNDVIEAADELKREATIRAAKANVAELIREAVSDLYKTLTADDDPHNNALAEALDSVEVHDDGTWTA